MSAERPHSRKVEWLLRRKAYLTDRELQFVRTMSTLEKLDERQVARLSEIGARVTQAEQDRKDNAR